MRNVDIENGQKHMRMQNRKSIIKKFAFALLCIGIIFLGGCSFFSCNIGTDANTVETAVKINDGEKLDLRLLKGEDFWGYIELGKPSEIAIENVEFDYSSVYLYAETDEIPAQLPPYDYIGNEENSDPAYAIYESKRVAKNGFQSLKLDAGKYYIRLHCIEVEAFMLFGIGSSRLKYMIVDNLPALPTDVTHIVAPNMGKTQLGDGYYTLDLAEERNDFTAEAIISKSVSHRVYFYYSENSSESYSFYFYNETKEMIKHCASTCTLPAGRTIIKISTYINSSHDGTEPDSTIKYTAVKAAPGTVFDREVLALPELPLGEELNLSEMFNLKIDFTGTMMHGLNSMHIDLTEASVLSVRIKDWDLGSLMVQGYYNTNPLNSVKQYSGEALFGWEPVDDMTLSFGLPAGLNLIELRVNLILGYSPEVFAASTIEFNISPVTSGQH